MASAMRSPRPYYADPGYQSAVSHPFYVSLWRDWRSDPTTVGFQDEAEARTFASLRPEPIVDVVDRHRGLVVAARRLLAYPGTEDHYSYRDDIPDERT